MEEVKVAQYGDKSLYIDQSSGQITIHSEGEVKIVNLLQGGDLELLKQEFAEHFNEILTLLRKVTETTVFENPKIQLPEQFFTKYSNTKEFDLYSGQFVGRESQILEMKTNFQNGKRIQVLYGMDGNGKTRLAAAYSRQMESMSYYTSLIWWFDARESAYIEEGIRKLAKQIWDERIFQDFNEIRSAVDRWFRTTRNWLIVFDDAPSEKAIITYFPEGNGHILITSSNVNWQTGLPNSETVSVPCLDSESAVALLLNRTKGRLSAEKAAEWADKLEGYPILLEILADFFIDGTQDENQFSANVFSQFSERHGNQKVFKQIISSMFQRIPKEGKKSWGYFCGIGVNVSWVAWMYSKNIPDYLLPKLITEGIAFFKPKKSGGFFSKWWHQKVLKFEADMVIGQSDCISSWAQKSMLYRVNKGTLSMNTFVHDSLFELFLDQPKYLEYFRSQLIEPLVNLLYKELYEASIDENGLEKTELLLPHAVSVLSKAKKRNFQTIEMAKLARRLSKHFVKQGQFIQAQEFAQYSYDLELRVLGKPSSWSMDEMMQSSLIIGEMGLYKTVLDQRKKTQGFSLSESLCSEALGNLMSGKDKDAAQLFEDAIRAADNLSSKKIEHWPLYLLAALSLAPSDWEKCVKHLSLSEKILLGGHSKESEEYSTFLWIKAAIHFKMPPEIKLDWQYSDSEEFPFVSSSILYREAYEIALHHKNFNHPVMLMLLSERILSALDCGEIEEAIACCEFFEKNIPELKQSLGEHSFAFANYEIAKAQIAYINNNYEDRKRHLEEALIILKRFYKNDSDIPQIIEIQKMIDNIS